jgi:hypothetical protein
LLVLLKQRGQVLAAAEAVLLAATLALAATLGALLVVVPAPRQPFTVVAFEEHPLSVATGHTSPVEVQAD